MKTMTKSLKNLEQQWRTLNLSISSLKSKQFNNHHHHHHHQRQIHHGPDTIDELIERHTVKSDNKTSTNDEQDDLITRRRLTSTKREAMSLYRDILRATRFFTWMDSRGALWRDVLRENARKEFEDARFEKDPVVVTRLLIGGREAVDTAIEKLVEKQKQQIDKEKADRDRR